jgi:glycosyltransferase involved in cell wall biosynthesis
MRCAGRRLIKSGFGRANVIYSSLGWGRPYLVEARRRGIPLVCEFYLRPSLPRVQAVERQAYPGWEPAQLHEDFETAIGSDVDPTTVADFIITPSAGVRDEVASFHHFAKERIFVVPYGVGEDLLSVGGSPVPGRVLFVGNCCLGKGIHYFAEAARLLTAQDGARYNFRAAGQVAATVKNRVECRPLAFLGRIPRGEVWGEYAQADVFVLPTLSDGSASVTYEALACGVPVITTPAAGSIVRHGTDGFIVPERDASSLAIAIRDIVTNRELRKTMGHSARSRAGEFTWNQFGGRLGDVLQRIIDEWR